MFPTAEISVFKLKWKMDSVLEILTACVYMYFTCIYVYLCIWCQLVYQLKFFELLRV